MKKTLLTTSILAMALTGTAMQIRSKLVLPPRKLAP